MFLFLLRSSLEFQLPFVFLKYLCFSSPDSTVCIKMVYLLWMIWSMVQVFFFISFHQLPYLFFFFPLHFFRKVQNSLVMLRSSSWSMLNISQLTNWKLWWKPMNEVYLFADSYFPKNFQNLLPSSIYPTETIITPWYVIFLIWAHFLSSFSL